MYYMSQAVRKYTLSIIIIIIIITTCDRQAGRQADMQTCWHESTFLLCTLEPVFITPVALCEVSIILRI